MARVIKENEVSSLVSHFSQIPDPRVALRTQHLLIDILVMTICAVLCGAKTCTDFEDYSLGKEKWLRKFLKLPHGIPSHDTFRRVLSIVDSAAMERVFLKWVEAIIGGRKLKSISLDGKSVAGSPQGGIGGRSALHLVNVYSHEYGLALTQVESNGSGGELTAAIDALDQLNIKDTLVLADANFTSSAIAEKIREKRGHYLLAIKGNRASYHGALINAFEASSSSKIKTYKKGEYGHGRDEVRRAAVLAANPQSLDEIFLSKWPGVKTLIRIERTRTLEDKRPFVQLRDPETDKIKHVRNPNQDGKTRISRTSHETAYYVTSKRMTAKEALREVRKHWGIENGLHWVLDVAFAEDDWLARAKRLSRNLSAIRKIGLNLIRSKMLYPKKSIRRHMNMAGWSDEILEKLVFGRDFDA